MFRRIPARCLCVALSAVWAVLAAPANAVPIGTEYLTFAEGQTRTFLNGSNPFDVVSSLSVEGTFAEADASLSPEDTGLADMEAMAQANLATGQLKAAAVVTSFDPMGFATASSLAVAAFGDSFTHFSGDQPFLFQSGTTTTFQFSIDGQWSESAAQFQTDAWLRLFIMEKGSLGDIVSDSGRIGCCAATEFLSNVHDVVTFGLTPSTIDTADFFDPEFGFIPVDQIVTGGLVEYVFSPGGDFDWYVELITAATAPAGVPPAGTNHFAITDFFNTIDVSYVAPSGVSVVSGSGAFPDTLSVVPSIPVPEPTPLVLLAAALAGLAGMRASAARRDHGTRTLP